MIGHAELSEDGRYRWLLTRRWPSVQLVGADGRPREPYVLWVGLNPSTADAREDDATIRRMVGFAKRWNMGGIAVANLFAARATQPRELYQMEDPIGPGDRGLKRLVSAARGAELVVVCWGAHERRCSDWPDGGRNIDRYPANWSLRGRASEVCQALAREGADLHCLGTTRDGHPRHPVRLGYDVELEPFDGLRRYPPEKPMELFCVCGHSYKAHTYDREVYRREAQIARAMGKKLVELDPEAFGWCRGKVNPQVPWHRDERWRPLRCQCTQFRLPEPHDYVGGPPPPERKGGTILKLIRGGAEGDGAA